MIRTYVDSLPKNYFNNIYQEVVDNVKHGENTCIAVMYGQSNKTIYKFITSNLHNENWISQIITIDHTSNVTKIIKSIQTKTAKNKNSIIIIRFLEKFHSKTQLLEKLKALQDLNNNIAAIAFTDYEPLIRPLHYSGVTTTFFINLIYVPPFNLKQTKLMIETLRKFYKWKINPKIDSKIYELSGGIARLIKYICKEVNKSDKIIFNLDNLQSNLQICFELNYLNKMLLELKPEELYKIGLLTSNGKIKSKLLHYYHQKSALVDLAKDFPYLSNGEYKILNFMIKNKGKALSIDRIAQMLKMSNDNFSLWAIYKIVSRLKIKIKKKYNIISIRKFGYILS